MPDLWGLIQNFFMESKEEKPSSHQRLLAGPQHSQHPPTTEELDVFKQLKHLDQQVQQLTSENRQLRREKRELSQQLAAAEACIHKGLISKVIALLDAVEIAYQTPHSDIQNHPWYQGMEAVHRQLARMLGDELHLVRFGRAGERFDPRHHDAIQLVEHADLPEGTVASVVLHGYRYREETPNGEGRQSREVMIRAAQVAVVQHR